MSKPTRKTLARNLADSLSQTPWHTDAIAACLRRRLPVRLHDFVRLQTQSVLAAFPATVAPPSLRIAAMLYDCLVFERIHKYCFKNDIWPASDLIHPTFHPVAPFTDLNIPALATLTDLADWLLLTPAQLDYYADQTGRHEEHGDMAVNHYHYHLHPKSNGGQRLIEAPKPRLKSLQRLIHKAILTQIPPHPDACGFIKGKSCLDGAARHVGEKVVMSFDLCDFFPNISAGRVFGLFRRLGYPANVAASLTGLCTNATPARVRDRMPFPHRQILRVAHLPQGAPTSPTLANLVAYRLDCRLSALAKSLGANYSRYADDMTFSGDGYIVRTLKNGVPAILQEEGFALNDAKTRVAYASTQQRVTGVVVNQHLNTPRGTFDHLKAVIHACKKPDDSRLKDPAFRAQLEGQIGWVAHVNPARGAKLRDLLAGQAAAP